MTTITLKIDKRTKAGKAFLAMTESFLQNVEGIEIVENLGNFDRVNEGQNPYNPEFIAKIKKAEANIKKGKTTRLNPDDIWGSIL
jgi:hypothetical protein